MCYYFPLKQLAHSFQNDGFSLSVLLLNTLIKGVFKISPLLSSHPQPPVKEHVGEELLNTESLLPRQTTCSADPSGGCFLRRTGPLP